MIKLGKCFLTPLMKDTLKTTVLSVLAKAIGFLVPFLIAVWFGITAETDAFFFSYALILFIITIFAPTIKIVLVPFLTEIKKSSYDKEVFISTLSLISILAVIILYCLFLIFSGPLLRLVTRFDIASIKLINLLLLETFAFVIISIYSSILEGLLNSQNRFAVPAISPAMRGSVNILVIFLLKDFLGVHSIAAGYVIGELFRLVLLIFAVKKYALLSFKLHFHFDSRVKKFFVTSIYQSIAMVIIGFSPIVDQSMASWLGGSRVSIMHYADRLYMIPYTVFVSGLMITLLSHWSDAYYLHGLDCLKSMVKKVALMTALLALCLTAIFILLKQNIINVVYARNLINQEELTKIGSVWFYYLLGLTPKLISMLFSRCLIILKKTFTLMIFAFLSVVLNIVLNLLLMTKYEIDGIAISTTFVNCISMLVLGFVIYIQKPIKQIHEERVLEAV